jgi:hypothetical protein
LCDGYRIIRLPEHCTRYVTPLRRLVVSALEHVLSSVQSCDACMIGKKHLHDISHYLAYLPLSSRSIQSIAWSYLKDVVYPDECIP